MNAGDSAPHGYQEPTVVWMVEYVDPREPGRSFQSGAFTTEAEAQKLLTALEVAGGYSELSINVVPVHQTIEDWEWDR
jgi:hypothetical protein